MISFPHRPRAYRGFSLLELMAVIATIGIMAAILLPALARAREAARRATCLSNLVQIGMALQMYADEHDGFYPHSGGNNDASCLVNFIPNYLGKGLVFECPSDASGPFRERNTKDPAPRILTQWDLDGVESVRGSYDYFGAYTLEPLQRPPAMKPIPKIPLIWDLAPIDTSRDHRRIYGEHFNHVPGGSNVYFMDGSAEFVLRPDLRDDGLPAAAPGIAYAPPFHFEEVDEDETARGRRGATEVFREQLKAAPAKAAPKKPAGLVER